MEERIQRIGIWALVVGLVAIFAWGVTTYFQIIAAEHAEEQAAKAAEQAQLEQDKLNLDSLLEEAASGDFSNMQEIRLKCLISLENRGYINVVPDFKNYLDVRHYLKGLHPYDTNAKISYLGLPTMSLAEMNREIAMQLKANGLSDGTSNFRMSVTFLSDSFSGLKNGWGIGTCGVRGNLLSEVRMGVLYVE